MDPQMRPCPICGELVSLGGHRTIETGAALVVVVDPPDTFHPHLRDAHPAEFAEAAERRAKLNATLGQMMGAMPRKVDGTFLRAGEDVGDITP